MDRMDIDKRLSEALKIRDRSKSDFQRAMAQRGVSGASTAAVYRYLGGEAEPSFAFVKAAAEELDVLPPWLGFGLGPRDEKEARLERQQEILAQLKRPDSIVEAIAEVETWGLEPDSRQKDALARFAQKIDDASFPGAMWIDYLDRISLLSMALGFLIRTDTAFQEVALNRPDPADPPGQRRRPGDYRTDLVQVFSASPGWYAVWSDAVLNAFASRVKGLGERGDEFWDAHEPKYPHTVDGMIEYNRQQSKKPNALSPMWHSDGKNPEYVETPDGDGEQEP